MTIKITIMTPKGIICSTIVDEVILPTLSGEVGILEGHAPLVTGLDTGLLRMKIEGKWTPMIIVGTGVAEVDQDRVLVLVSEVEEITTLELSEVSKQLEEATAVLNAIAEGIDSKEKLEIYTECKRAFARVDAVKYIS
jgi:F-type H+-transporting ATPase subunit epsilon